MTFERPGEVAQSVPAAGCGSVSLPAETPGGTPGEPAGEDARAMDGPEFTPSLRDSGIVEALRKIGGQKVFFRFIRLRR